MIATIRDKVLDGKRLDRAEGRWLLADAPLLELGALAAEARRARFPENVVTFVIDSNPNYTNVCITDCQFCAFYRKPGDPEEAVAERAMAVRDRITFLGKVSEADKARMLRSVDLYVAPNTGGESFGMILTEAMAAGTPVVASDLDAFRRVLDGGRAGALFPVGDADVLAGTIGTLLDDPDGRADLAGRAAKAVAGFDWPTVAARVVEVYATAIEASPPLVADLD